MTSIINESSSIDLSRDGNIATLTINNQDKRNAINTQMWQQLIDHCETINADSTIRVVIVTGAGDVAFSAGADIGEFKKLALEPEQLKINNRLIQRAQIQLEELQRPTIAMVRGSCFGGGCGLALACDYRMAQSNSVFAITPAKLGILFSTRDTGRLLNLAGPGLTKEMLYTGRQLQAQEALDKGIINRIFTQEELFERTQAIARDVAASSQHSIREIKQIISYLQGFGELTEEEIESRYNAAFNLPDCQEGMAAFVGKRPPKFTWG